LIALVQRVTGANVKVAGDAVGVIGAGILALVGVERGDTEVEALLLAERVVGYRIFPDAEGRMNLSLKDVRGQLLAVPQFTLAADTSSGARPSFSSAAGPVPALRRKGGGMGAARRHRALRRPHAGQPGERRAGDFLAAGFAEAKVLNFAGETTSIISRSRECASSRWRIFGGW
jgi:D-tyrosyl-tRNA(Tyr) deacylase